MGVAHGNKHKLVLPRRGGTSGNVRWFFNHLDIRNYFIQALLQRDLEIALPMSRRSKRLAYIHHILHQCRGNSSGGATYSMGICITLFPIPTFVAPSVRHIGSPGCKPRVDGISIKYPVFCSSAGLMNCPGLQAGGAMNKIKHPPPR